MVSGLKTELLNSDSIEIELIITQSKNFRKETFESANKPSSGKNETREQGVIWLMKTGYDLGQSWLSTNQEIITHLSDITTVVCR